MTPLETLLSEIGTATAKGDFARLSSISSMLETVFIPSDPATLLRSARIAQQNAALLSAAANGVRAAQRRLMELRVGPRLTTYDGHGKKSDLPTAQTGTRRF